MSIGLANRAALVVFVATLTAGVVAGSASGAAGDLAFRACFADTNAAGCSVPAQAALDGAIDATVSPDGGSVYVTSFADSSISHFSRAADGTLTFQNCFADTGAAGCTVPGNAALSGANRVTVSPDGASVYVTSSTDNSISHFSRAANGNLTFQNCFADTGAAGCTVPAPARLSGAGSVTVSPDGASVYVTSFADNAISHFGRAANGILTFKNCVADPPAGGCSVPAQAALGGPSGVAVSPDGGSVYVISVLDQAISHFNRAANGNLTFLGCFAVAGGSGCSPPAPATLGPGVGVTVSPDGGSVYVTESTTPGRSSISHFTRAANGNLTPQGCIADTDAAGCSVAAQAALDGAGGVQVSPDGGSLYVSSANADSISRLNRAADGSLTFASCVADTNAAGCSVPAQAALNDANRVAVSPDGSSVYVTAFLGDSISHFTPEVVPADTTAPETTKGKGPAKKVKTRKKKVKLKFKFASPETGVTFECSLDAAAFALCTSPAKAKVKAKPKTKKHSFRVRAVDAAANADPTPVKFTFKVKRKRKR